MIEKHLRHFLEKYCDTRPLLLALSGGPDSRALFHLLLEVGHPFHVAHVDHGWRSESSDEAAQLQKLCVSHHLPFHLHTLKNTPGEDACRQARYTFFQQIVAQENLQGVILAHHSDDQAETVLKRLFEGASLPKLKGLVPVAQREALTLFRPFLDVQKKEILTWLSERDIPYFHDETNSDPRYLRSRMRQELIPELSRLFGKGIGTSLCRVGQSAGELGEFLEPLLHSYRQQVVRTEGGVELDLGKNTPQTPYLWKAVLRDFFECEGIAIPQSVLETCLFHLQNQSSQTPIHVGKRRVLIHHQRLKLMC